MPDRRVFSFPRMGSYHAPLESLLRRLFPEDEVLPPPPLTVRTLELGGESSPDFICAPFKYNMGSYLQALGAGANVLLQTGMGCRCGYYAEVQERILKDLGFSFEFVGLTRENARPAAIYRRMRALGSPASPAAFAHALVLAFEAARLIDRFEFYMRENLAFERVSGSFEALHAELLRAVGTAKSLPALWKTAGTLWRRLNALALDRPPDPLRVGVVGELFTLMEPESNFGAERILARLGVSVSRRMSVTFLLWNRKERALRGCGGYLTHAVGANGADSVAQSLRYARRGYDGILHMKSFGCAPELSASPALDRLSADLDIPVLHLSFDTQTSEAGVRTRLEAFADMIAMRREKRHAAGGVPGRGRGLDFNKGRSY